jgi:hypothetical protein
MGSKSEFLIWKIETILSDLIYDKGCDPPRIQLFIVMRVIFSMHLGVFVVGFSDANRKAAVIMGPHMPTRVVKRSN